MSRPNPDSKSAEDYRARQFETFQMIGSVPSDWRWDGAEPTENRNRDGGAAGGCLCGKEPIAYEYTLVKKADSMERMIVGSECVSSFVDAAPWSDQRKVKEAMKHLTLLNKMTNYLVKKEGKSYEEARAKAAKMDDYDIQRLFANLAKGRAVERLTGRAAVLRQFMLEHREKLWDVNWFYFQPRTILSSLAYMAQTWESGHDTPYMNGPMNAALGRLGLKLPKVQKAEVVA